MYKNSCETAVKHLGKKLQKFTSKSPVNSAVAGPTIAVDPDDISPESSDEEDGSSASVTAQEKAIAVIDSVREMLKMDPVGVSDVVPVPFGTHKPARALP